MKTLFLFLSLAVLITFTSCQKEVEVDPKIGTWEVKNASIPNLSSTTKYDVQIFVLNSGFSINISEAGASTTTMSSEADLDSEVSTDIYIYKATQINFNGASVGTSEPYSKVKIVVSDDTMNFSGYSAHGTAAEAEAETTIELDLTLTRQ
jgi:hypothetical protein